jgi:hypothetical protein
MLAMLLLLALPAPAPAALLAPLQQSAPAAEDPAFEAKLTAAGTDVAKLLDLATACTTSGQGASARKAWTKVLEIDPANEAAHKGLNHQLYAGKWFESFAELSKFKRDEDAQMKAKGLARFKDSFVPAADVPYLKMGWTKTEGGAWVNPVDAALAAEVAKREADGFQFRADDSSWVAPDEQKLWKQVLWKCGEEWVEMRVANAYHADLAKCWKLTGDHFVVWTTCEWDKGNSARWYAEMAWPDLVRLFGVEPAGRPRFVVLNSLAQYNQASGGNTPLIPESAGESSVYGAYFADLAVDRAVTPPQYAGCGVSFWDTDRNLTAWGPYWLRWAAAQSFVDAIDPSWEAVGEAMASGGQPGQTGIPGFWTEKKVPKWLRYGAAAYVDRFLKNPEAAEGADPWDIRAFAFKELKQAGGLRPLDQVFAFKVDLTKPEDSAKLYHEAGLLVSYVLDGAEKDKAVTDAHAAFCKAMASGSKDDVTAAVTALTAALTKSDKEIRAFAGL